MGYSLYYLIYDFELNLRLFMRSRYDDVPKSYAWFESCIIPESILEGWLSESLLFTNNLIICLTFAFTVEIHRHIKYFLTPSCRARECHWHLNMIIMWCDIWNHFCKRWFITGSPCDIRYVGIYAHERPSVRLICVTHWDD